MNKVTAKQDDGGSSSRGKVYYYLPEALKYPGSLGQVHIPYLEIFSHSTWLGALSYTYLNILKSCDQMYLLLGKTQKSTKNRCFLHISQEQRQLVTLCDHIKKHDSMLYKTAIDFLFGSKFPRSQKHSHLLSSLNKSCSPFAKLYKYIQIMSHRSFLNEKNTKYWKNWTLFEKTHVFWPTSA